MTKDLDMEEVKNTSLNENQILKKKSRKPLLFLSMLSMAMLFVALTSAYIVSKNSNSSGWTEIDLTPSFMISTILVVLSSIAVHFGLNSAKQGDFSKSKMLMLGGLILGIAFSVFQFVGFDELFKLGHVAAGSKATTASSYIYAMVILHFAHMIGALISLAVVVLNLHFNKYSKNYYLGIELATMFWHFLGFIWVYIYFFLNTFNTVS
jgi:cytochrome c oxidase subunit 3